MNNHLYLIDSYRAVKARTAEAARRCGRDPAGVMLLAVSKTFPAEVVRQVAELGQRDFGENYLKEALEKIRALADLDLCWHFIGPIQSNKTREIAENFTWVHSIDRLKIARRLSEQRPDALPPLQVCIQVNISGEATKSGVAPEDAPELAAEVAVLPRLRLRGLMAIPAPEIKFEAQRDVFRRLRRVQEDLCARGLALDTLSMGMSDDLEAAIAEGSTIVRVGSAIFGARAKQ
ncbi:MAG: YggS family pyridoxal phosphate-dependent enzyme [Pseudomonadota bacterium]